MRRLMLLSGCLCLGACIEQPPGYPGGYGAPYYGRGYPVIVPQPGIGAVFYERERVREDRGRQQEERQRAAPGRQQREAEPARAARPDAHPAPAAQKPAQRPEHPRSQHDDDHSRDRR